LGTERFVENAVAKARAYVCASTSAEMSTSASNHCVYALRESGSYRVRGTEDDEVLQRCREEARLLAVCRDRQSRWTASTHYRREAHDGHAVRPGVAA